MYIEYMMSKRNQQLLNCSIVSKFVHNIELSPANHITSAESFLLIGRYFEKGLYVYWSPATYFNFVCRTWIQFKKCARADRSIYSLLYGML